MDILGQSAFLVAVTALALGVSILARNLRNKLYLAYGIGCSVISLWALTFFLESYYQEGSFYWLHLLFNVWLAPAGMGFVRVMVRNRDGMSRRMMELAVAMSMGLTGALILGFEDIDWVRWAIMFAPALLAAQILRLLWLDRISKPQRRRASKRPTVGLDSARRGLIYLGALFVLSSCVMDHVPAVGRVLPALGNIALTIYLFFLSQAITQQRLLNVGALMSRFLVLLTLALVLTAVYSLLFAWIKNRPALFFLNSFLISFLLVVLLDPLRTFVRYLTQMLITREHRRLLAALREAQMRLAGQTDPQSLFDSVLATVRQVIRPERAALFVLGGEGTQYERVRVVEREPSAHAARSDVPPLRRLLVSHPLLQYCEEQKRRGDLPVLLDQVIENEVDRSAGRGRRESLLGLLQGLKALESNLLIPMFDSGRILAFVTLYAPSPPEPWGNNWGILQIVYPFFEQAAQTLRSMEVFARQRERERLAALGEMAAGLAHEIRNPLGAIKGAAQFLEPEETRPDARFLRVIIEETDRLNHVVSQFLDYSKPASGDFERVNLAAVAERTLETLKIGGADPALIRFEALSPRAWVKGAPVQLQQLLVNLVQNAMRAVSEVNVPRVQVTVGTDEQASPRAVFVEIEDNGKGIRPENLEKIFIPFFTTESGGTGLGLSICQKIAENHGGRIEVTSEEGQYARFTVRLPEVADA